MQPLRAPDRALMETKQARRSIKSPDQSSEGAASVPEPGRGRPSSRRVTVLRARRTQGGSSGTFPTVASPWAAPS